MHPPAQAPAGLPGSTALRARGGGGPLTRLKRFAHRGASALAPENTLAAFDLAIRLGCDWIETDLRLTADQVPVIIHDTHVERTTDGKGRVDGFSLPQLRRLEAGRWGNWSLQGERIPTLDELLEWGRGVRCGMNLEIKEDFQVDELIRQLAARFKGSRSLDRVLFSSFRTADLLRLRAAFPQARLAWLASRHSRGLTPLDRRVGLAAMHPKDNLINRRLVKRCRRLGLAVHVWVVNQQRRLAELEALPVDGVMTDDPRIFGTPSPRACQKPPNRYI